MNDNYKILWNRTISTLFNHFYYSIADINSYDELTEKEKKIVSKDVYDYLVRLKDSKWMKKEE